MNAMFLRTLKGKVRGNARATVTDHHECTERLDALLDVAQKASSIPEITALLNETLEMAQRISGATASSLLMMDEDQQALHFLVAEGEAGDEVRDLAISLDTGVCGWVVRNAKPVIIDNVDEDDRFDHRVDDLTGFVTFSIMAVPIFRGGRVIGVLEVINKEDEGNFAKTDLQALSDFCDSRPFVMLVSMLATTANNIRTHQIMIDWYKSMLETLIGAIDAKDPYAQGHSRRVKELSLGLARALKLPPEELQVIELGALLHDIGKIDIHDIVLRKAGPLTDVEMYTMRKHALRGSNLLIELPFLEKVRDIVLYHHERYDGTGYPNGLKGNAIPLRARIVAVAEAYDTMTTDRAYRAKMSAEDALEELKRDTGTQFCPTVMKVFPDVVGHREPVPAEEPIEAGEEAVEPEADFAPPVPFGMARKEVRLFVTEMDDHGSLRRFRKVLERTEDIKILMDTNSEDEGTMFIVSVREGMPLAEVLRQLSMVCDVEEGPKQLTVTVRTPISEQIFQRGFNLDSHV